MSFTSLITINDFKGELSLALTKSDINQLNEVIDTITPEYMQKLLGIDVYEDFETDIVNDTPEAKWTNLWNGVKYTDNYTSASVKFEGCKKMMVHFIYYHLKKSNTFATLQGDYNNEVDNSTISNNDVTNRKIDKIFNKGYDIYVNAFNFMKSSLLDGRSDYDGIMFQEIERKNINY